MLQSDKNLIKSNCVDYAHQPIADSTAFLLIMNYFFCQLLLLLLFLLQPLAICMQISLRFAAFSFCTADFFLKYFV